MLSDDDLMKVQMDSITYRLSRRSSGEGSRVEDGGAHLESLLIIT